MPNRANKDNSLEEGLWRIFNIIVSPPEATGFHVRVELLVFKDAVTPTRGGMRIEQIKMSRTLLFLLVFSCFSCINGLWFVTSLWLISVALKKLILTVFFFFFPSVASKRAG